MMKPNRRMIILAAIALTTTWLAGCTGDPSDADAGRGPDAQVSDETTLAVTIPAGAGDVAREGPWYVAESFTVGIGETVRFYNSDDVTHHVVGEMVDTEHEPGWLGAYEQGHGHDGPESESHHGYEEGGHMSGEGARVIDLEVGPGDWAEVVLPAEGTLRLDCEPHPWMNGTLDVVHNAPEDHVVTVNTLAVGGATNGTGRMGHGGEARTMIPLGLTAPNLVSIEATLAWDDAEDDGPLGHDGNGPDTLRFALVAPDNTTVAEQTVTAREGDITVSFAAPIDWPASVNVRDHQEGKAILDGMETWASSGSWTLVVELVAAPGYPNTGDGSDSHDASFVPGADGVQSWQVEFSAVHEWAGLEGGPREDHVALDFGESAEDHEH